MITDAGEVIAVYREYKDKIGRFSFKESRVLAAPADSRGYRVAHLYRMDGSMWSVRVHRLVAVAFLDGGDEQINHIDGDKLNNQWQNLEWTSASGNQFHRHCRKRHVKLSATEIMQIRADYRKVPTKVLADKYNVDRSTIWRLAHGGRHKNAEHMVTQMEGIIEGQA